MQLWHSPNTGVSTPKTCLLSPYIVAVTPITVVVSLNPVVASPKTVVASDNTVVASHNIVVASLNTGVVSHITTTKRLVGVRFSAVSNYKLSIFRLVSPGFLSSSRRENIHFRDFSTATLFKEPGLGVRVLGIRETAPGDWLM